MDKFLTFVINLNRHEERFTNLSLKLKDASVEIRRIEAVEPSTLRYGGLNHFGTTPDVLSSCWESHRLAFEEFLKSDNEICLILEDDVDFTQKSLEVLNSAEYLASIPFDVLQIGFVCINRKLDNGKSQLFEVARYHCKEATLVTLKGFISLYFWIFRKITRTGDPSITSGDFSKFKLHRLLQSLARRIDKFLGRRLPVEFFGYKNRVVNNDFQAGTHAYFIRRKAAKFLLGQNSPSVFAPDLLYIALARASNLEVNRTLKSLASQNESLVSDINSRSRIYG